VLSATLVDSEHMTATVAAAQLSTAGVVKVSLQSPAPGNFESNKLDFDVIALPPVVSSLSPNSVPAESPGLTLTVNGSNFTADSQVLWNGTPLATTFVSATKVTAQISAALLEVGQSNGVAVRNQSPEERISDAAVFEVNSQKKVFLPLVSR
jgi:trimeric autotransporter adhesin